MKCTIITIGDEILIGQIVDTNSAWLASELNLLGVDVVEMRSIGDEQDRILDAIDEGFETGKLVIITGGLGPTKDDITKAALCKYYGSSLVFSPETRDHITAIYARFGRSFTEAHEQQCYMPSNAKLLKNSMGTAPGMLFEDERGILLSVPGVPFEMKAIFREAFIDEFKKHLSQTSIQHSTILTVGEGETFIADRIEPLLTEMPAHIKLAYLPSLGSVRLRLTGKHEDAVLLSKQLDFFTQKITQELGSLVYGFNDDNLESCLRKMFTEKGWWLATAESCTGGYLAHRITGIAGSSEYFKGGLIPYSNECKVQWLGVKEQTLAAHGAVSEPVVKEMVEGLIQQMKVDVGVAISGIAGPGGGSPEKPVGTIWIAVGNSHSTETRLIKASKDRLKNIEYAAIVAMNLTRRFLLRN